MKGNLHPDAAPAFEKSIELYKAILAALPECIYLFDRDKNFLDMHNALGDENSTSRAFVGANVLAYATDPTYPYHDCFVLFNEAFDRLLETGESQKFEFQIHDEYFESVLTAIGEEYIMSHVRNISLSVRNQLEAKRISHNELSMAMTAGGLSSWKYDVATQMLFSTHDNDVIGERIAYEDLMWRILPGYRWMVPDMFDKIINRGAPRAEITVQVRNNSGETIWTNVHAMPQFYTPDGKVSVIVGSQKDVTRELFYEKNRNELLKQNELVMNNANCGFVYITPDYKVAWENVTKVLPPEFEDGSYFFEVGELCYKNEHRLENSYSRRFVTAAFTEKITQRTERRMSSSFWAEMSATPVIADNGTVEGVVLKIEDITERKTYIQKIEESERRIAANNQLLHTVIDSMPCSLFIKDADDDYRYLVANKKFCELLANPTRNLQGKTDYELFPPEAAGRFRRDDMRAVKEGVQIMPEESVPFGGKEQIWHTTKTSLYDPADHRTLLIGVGMDITDIKEATRKMEKSEQETTAVNQLLLTILDCMPCSFFIKDADNDFRYLMANQWYYNLLQFTETNFIGKTDYDLFLKERADQYRADDLKVMEEDSLRVIEEEMILHTGETRIWHTNKKPLVTPDGSQRLVIAVALDVTEQIEEQREIEYSKNILELTFAAGSIVPWEWDMATGRMSSRDQSALFTNDDYTVERFLDERIHPDYKENFRKSICELRDGVGEVDCRVKVMYQGAWEWMNVIGRRINDPRTGHLKGVGITRIITDEVRKQEELMKAKKKAEQSDALKSSFLANMSHEIRTPLNAIVGFSELVCEAEEDEDRDTYLHIIRTNSELLLRLINDILDLSKIEAGYVDYINSRFDLTALFSDQETVFRENMPEGVRLVNCSPRGCCEVVLDKFRVSQILTNFLTNARKFTAQGSIEMGYEIVEGGVKLYVRDTGCGISPENQEKVFDRFEKLDKFAQGTGLGMAICKAIAEAYQGKIGLLSNLGEGALFWVYLPTEVYLSEDVSRESYVPVSLLEDGKEGVESPLKILVAEDNDSNYLLVKMMLKGYSVSRAENGAEAVEMVRPGNFDLVLMDVRMPVMDGLEATRVIREFNRDLPIVALTANAFESDRLEVIEAGCNGFLTKPVKRAELFELLGKGIGR